MFNSVHSNWVKTTDRKPLISIKERKHFYFSYPAFQKQDLQRKSISDSFQWVIEMIYACHACFEFIWESYSLILRKCDVFWFSNSVYLFLFPVEQKQNDWIKWENQKASHVSWIRLYILNSFNILLQYRRQCQCN